MAPRTAWSRGNVLVVAVVGIGNTKQWKTKRVLCVNYQEIFKIKSGLVSYSVVIFMFLFLSVGVESRKCFDTAFVIQISVHQPKTKNHCRPSKYVIITISYIISLHQLEFVYHSISIFCISYYNTSDI